MRDPILYEFETYLYAQGRDLVEDDSISYPLFSAETLTGTLAELRAMLTRHEVEFRPEMLQGPVADGIRSFAGEWFQRIDFPAHGICTLSDRSWGFPFDEGGVNTLGRNLTSEEACLLRPWPKWMYVRPLLPDLRGKSVLEVGSNNGFFPIRFAEMGAARVTGIEVQKRRHQTAVWANSVLGWDSIEFRHSDFLVDFTVEPHDIIFVSEVVNHMLCPLWAVARLVSLAKEMLILDSGVFETSRHGLELSNGRARDDHRLLFLHFQISDGLLRSYLKLLGLRAEEIVKYVEPEAGHILYKIDTRMLHARRANGEEPENEELSRSLRMELTLPR